jgi:hypothetical protein
MIRVPRDILSRQAWWALVIGAMAILGRAFVWELNSLMLGLVILLIFPGMICLLICIIASVRHLRREWKQNERKARFPLMVNLITVALLLLVPLTNLSNRVIGSITHSRLVGYPKVVREFPDLSLHWENAMTSRDRTIIYQELFTVAQARMRALEFLATKLGSPWRTAADRHFPVPDEVGREGRGPEHIFEGGVPGLDAQFFAHPVTEGEVASTMIVGLCLPKPNWGGLQVPKSLDYARWSRYSFKKWLEPRRHLTWEAFHDSIFREAVRDWGRDSLYFPRESKYYDPKLRH